MNEKTRLEIGELLADVIDDLEQLSVDLSDRPRDASTLKRTARLLLIIIECYLNQ